MFSDASSPAIFDLDEGKPLWKYVTKLEKVGKGGGNYKFQCSFCNGEYKGSYTRVRAHLMKTKNMGIVVCQKVTNNNIVQFQRIEAEAASREESSQPKKVPLPPSTTSFGINFSQTLESKKRRISGSSTGSNTALEKAFNIGAREQLHSEIARMFYSTGLPFH